MFKNCSVPLRDASGAIVTTPTLSCVFPLLADGISWLLEFSGVVAVIIIIYSGIMLTASGGDPKKIEDARRTFTFAILGLFLILASFAIVRFISQITGVSCIDPRFPLFFQSCN